MAGNGVSMLLIIFTLKGIGITIHIMLRIHHGKIFILKFLGDRIMNNLLAYIVYYAGAYGNTIRIATRSENWIRLLKENVINVLEGNTNSFDICKMPYIKCFESISSLLLLKVGKSKPPCIILECIDQKNYFRWEQNSKELEHLLGLIDGLLDSNTPGHQYLEGNDTNFVIEFSYNEDTTLDFNNRLV